MNRENKTVNVNELQKLGIADSKGVIDYPKFTKYKAKQKTLGYEIVLSLNEEYEEEGHHILDNEPVKYGNKLHTRKINFIK